MTIAQLISQYSKLLKSSSPILDIELLLSRALNKPKEYLYTYPEKKLTTKQLNNFTTLFKRRLKGEPIAYILGHKEFFGLYFKVNKNVLIPRPETEQLVEEVIKYCQSRIYNLKSIISIIEIGVGSGAVIISLAKNLPKSSFTGTDISAKALTVAKLNAKIHGVFCHPEPSRRIDKKPCIKFLQGNLLSPLKSKIYNLKSSIIVANLPYLDTKQLNLSWPYNHQGYNSHNNQTKPRSDNQQLHYEPKTALAGGPDGLKYFRDFFHQLQQYKLQPQAIFLEIGHNQGAKIKNLAKISLPKYKFKCLKDLCGLNRIVILTK